MTQQSLNAKKMTVNCAYLKNLLKDNEYMFPEKDPLFEENDHQYYKI